MSSHEIEQQLLKEIIGEELSSVEFVQDYLQLRFNGPCLTAVTQPTIATGERILVWNEPSYRDELCNQIGHKVKAVDIHAGEYVEVVLDDDVVIRISLKDSDYRTAEAAKFDSSAGEWWVI